MTIENIMPNKLSKQTICKIHNYSIGFVVTLS